MSNPSYVKGEAYTIGHSTRPIDEFLYLLRANDIALLADVRTIPKSRRNPQFNIDVLPASLADAGIAHEHMPGLGGLRHTLRDSPNEGWRNASFRGYADYMQTAEFEINLAHLMDVMSRSRTAIMCAEALPWRCHRSLIADALVVRGFAVNHIFSAGKIQKHVITKWAKVEGTKITYPAPTEPSVLSANST